MGWRGPIYHIAIQKKTLWLMIRALKMTLRDPVKMQFSVNQYLNSTVRLNDDALNPREVELDLPEPDRCVPQGNLSDPL